MSTQVTETKSFDGQVAGHGNILILPNNILIKRSYPKEINFYKLIKEKNLPLQNFMPKCYNHDPSYEEIKGIIKMSKYKNLILIILLFYL